MPRNKPRSRPALRLPVIDIVITTAGRFDELRKCLQTLHNQAQEVSFAIAVYIVDNGSDAEERLIESNAELFSPREETQYFSEFKSKRLAKNIGFPGAANDGARMGSAPLIMFLSDDVELMPGTLEKIVRRMDDPTIGITGIKLLFPPTSTDPNRPAGKVQHVGLALDIHGNPIHALVGWRADHPKCCVSREVFAVTGACLTIRRKLFNQVGGFDLAYGKGTFEDVSLCLSVRQLGSKIFMDADAMAYHYVGATAEKRKEPFPLGINSMMFKSRWANSGLMIWDEFLAW